MNAQQAISARIGYRMKQSDGADLSGNGLLFVLDSQIGKETVPSIPVLA